MKDFLADNPQGPTLHAVNDSNWGLNTRQKEGIGFGDASFLVSL